MSESERYTGHIVSVGWYDALDCFHPVWRDAGEFPLAAAEDRARARLAEGFEVSEEERAVSGYMCPGYEVHQAQLCPRDGGIDVSGATRLVAYHATEGAPVEPLTFDGFQHDVSRTAPDEEGERLVSNAVLGMCGEVGEFAELFKKAWYQGHDLDPKKAVEELGDVMYYVFLAAEALGVSAEEVALANVAKRAERYPDGFSEGASLGRDEDAEAVGAVLEGARDDGED